VTHHQADGRTFYVGIEPTRTFLVLFVVSFYLHLCCDWVDEVVVDVVAASADEE